MVEDGFDPDASSYAKLILACGLCHDLAKGQRCINTVLASRIPKTSFFYHSMIDLYSRCGQLDRAVAVLNEVRHSLTVEPSHYHYEPIVKLLAERGQWDDVDGFLKAWGDVSYSTYLYLIMDCYKRSLWDKVVKYDQMMEAAGQRPYSSLVPLVEDAKKKMEMNSEPHLNWSDMDFNLDFDLDINNSLF